MIAERDREWEDREGYRQRESVEREKKWVSGEM